MNIPEKIERSIFIFAAVLIIPTILFTADGPPNDFSRTILFGDSISLGCPFNIERVSRNGWTASDLLDAVHLLPHDATEIILFAGLNDLRIGCTNEQMLINVEYLISYIQEQCPRAKILHIKPSSILKLPDVLKYDGIHPTPAGYYSLFTEYNLDHLIPSDPIQSEFQIIH